MKFVKPIVLLASIAALFVTLPGVGYAATITLRPNLDSTSQLLAASTQESSCATPHAAAAFANTPFFEVPEVAQAMGDRGNSVVEIDLLPNGVLKHYALEQSSGNVVLDESAFRTARMTKYQAEVQNCVAVSGSYLLEVDF